MSQRQPDLRPTQMRGFSCQLDVRREADDRYIVRGVGEDGTEWAYTLTTRATRQMWFDITRILYPEKSDEVLGQVNTIPSLPSFRPEQTDLTTWTFVSQKPDSSFEITGWVGRPGWQVKVSAHEMFPFWAALDQAMFPAGWKS